MKKIIFLLSIILTTNCFSQNIDESTRKKFSSVLDMYTDIWINVPGGVDTRTINQGVNFSLLYDYRFGKSNFSFAIGLGIGAHNFYSNSFPVVDSLGNSILEPISDLYPGIDYKRNKISVTYFDIPLELRLRTKKEIRASVGLKFGFLINSHTKYVGDDYISYTDDKLRVKFRDVKNIETFRYGITARVGWKWVNLIGYYSFAGLFKKDKGPDLYPISVGISLIPF